jgi:putative Ca2+/H+ antiporter (TMEM165/GDT1 family)
VIFRGNAFSNRLPLRAIHYPASALFAVVGVIFIVRAAQHWS